MSIESFQTLLLSQVNGFIKFTHGWPAGKPWDVERLVVRVILCHDVEIGLG